MSQREPRKMSSTSRRPVLAEDQDYVIKDVCAALQLFKLHGLATLPGVPHAAGSATSFRQETRAASLRPRAVDGSVISSSTCSAKASSRMKAHILENARGFATSCSHVNSGAKPLPVTAAFLQRWHRHCCHRLCRQRQARGAAALLCLQGHGHLLAQRDRGRPGSRAARASPAWLRGGRSGGAPRKRSCAGCPPRQPPGSGEPPRGPHPSPGAPPPRPSSAERSLNSASMRCISGSWSSAWSLPPARSSSSARAARPLAPWLLASSAVASSRWSTRRLVEACSTRRMPSCRKPPALAAVSAPSAAAARAASTRAQERSSTRRASGDGSTVEAWAGVPASPSAENVAALGAFRGATVA